MRRAFPASAARLAAGLALLLALLLAATAALAQDFPKLSGRVVDEAGLLPPDREQALTEALAALQQQSGRQLVVATIPDLQGYDIADYGYRLGRAWGIGSKGEDDGILLIVAPNERQMRIEVGYGLEPYVTDALSSIIINETIRPRFRAGDMVGGIEAGVAALIEQLRLPPEEAQARQAQLLKEGRGRSEGKGAPGALIFWAFVLIVVVLPMIFGGRGGGGGGGRGKRYRRRRGMPVVIWGPGICGGWGGGGGSWGGGGGGGFGGFSGGGGSFGGGGASGSW